MAPEQILGRPVTTMIDVFALGALAAYAVLSRTPFGGGLPDAVSYRVLHQPPDLDGCPPRLRALVEPCLAKHPPDRPQVGQVLQPCLEHADTVAAGVPAPATERPTGMASGNQEAPLLSVARQHPHRARQPTVPDRPRQPPQQADGRRRRRAVILTTGALAIAAAGAAVTLLALPGRTSPPPAGPCASSPPSSHGGPAPRDSWGLASAQGTKVSDATGQYPATAQDVQWNPGYAGAFFNGHDSQVSTARPVLNTGPGASFTVAAWVCLTSARNIATAVSEDNNEGGGISGFYLQYLPSYGQWSFTRSASDTTSVNSGSHALSTGPAALDTWVHLVGVYDAHDDQLRLYVNGALQGTVPDTETFASDGGLVIGRAEFNGGCLNWFTGYISDAEVFQQASRACRPGTYRRRTAGPAGQRRKDRDVKLAF